LDEELLEPSGKQFLHQFKSHHTSEEAAITLSITPASVRICQNPQNPRKMHASRV